MKATEAVTPEASDRLATFLDMLRRWNARIRLTGLDLRPGADPLADSLGLHALVPPGVSAALDIGSGNGLPALPLCIAFGVPYTLVEADHRKAAFLREVVRELACPATVAAQRVEDMPPHPVDLITARAFGPLSRLLPLVHPWQAPGTVCLFPKGRNAGQELEDARRDWSFDAAVHPAPAGCVVQVSSIQPRPASRRAS